MSAVGSLRWVYIEVIFTKLPGCDLFKSLFIVIILIPFLNILIKSNDIFVVNHKKKLWNWAETDKRNLSVTRSIFTRWSALIHCNLTFYQYLHLVIVLRISLPSVVVCFPILDLAVRLVVNGKNKQIDEKLLQSTFQASQVIYDVKS